MPTLTLMQADEVLAHASPSPTPKQVAGTLEQIDAARRLKSWLLTDALHEADGLPPALARFRLILEGAQSDALPCRPQSWRSAQLDGHGKPLKSGTGTQDPNFRIRGIANNFLLLMRDVKEFGKAEDGSDDEKASAILDELRYWEGQLKPVRDDADALRRSLEAYRQGAPERFVP